MQADDEPDRTGRRVPPGEIDRLAVMAMMVPVSDDLPGTLSAGIASGRSSPVTRIS